MERAKVDIQTPNKLQVNSSRSGSNKISENKSEKNFT